VISWKPKIGRHVTYFKVTNRKPKPGVITAVTSDTVVSIRVGHSGEAYASVTKETTANSPHYSSQTNVWRNV